MYNQLYLAWPLRLSLALFRLLSRFVLGSEIQTDAVDTVPLIGRGRITFALEDVAEVASAVGADDLGPRHAEGAVFVPGDGAGDAVEVGRPATPGLELVVCLVQRRVAARTSIDASV